ncbi:hypothetical protein SUGI_1514520 [Cryptomeria japonica]|uniref:Uncharacterized protein n=1 Tax=Cryptomeria japonica TaxID=3369 RepID=A0AAD3NPI2_CRYJA|nr:hypothetical protein SUGI_1514520 [Cryptomeria japonica]
MEKKHYSSAGWMVQLCYHQLLNSFRLAEIKERRVSRVNWIVWLHRDREERTIRRRWNRRPTHTPSCPPILPGVPISLFRACSPSTLSSLPFVELPFNLPPRLLPPTRGHRMSRGHSLPCRQAGGLIG